MKEAETNTEESEAAIWMDINELNPWEDNPRENEEAISAVVKSIKRFGFGAPIVARKADLMIIKGHTRRKAVLELGSSWHRVPVRLMDISREEAELLALADNKLGEIATWNDDELKEVLNRIKEDDRPIIGWSEDAVTALFLEIQSGENDPYAEWSNMPEFKNEDLNSVQKITVHFENQSDVDSFSALIQQKITEKTKWLWYPQKKNEDHESFRY